MDYGDVSPSEDICLRIAVYDGKLISKLVMSDTLGLTGPNPRRLFGAGKVCSSRPYAFDAHVFVVCFLRICILLT